MKTRNYDVVALAKREDFGVLEWGHRRLFGRSFVSNGTLEVLFRQKENYPQRSRRKRVLPVLEHVWTKCRIRGVEWSGESGRNFAAQSSLQSLPGGEANCTGCRELLPGLTVSLEFWGHQMGKAQLLSSRYFLCL